MITFGSNKKRPIQRVVPRIHADSTFKPATQQVSSEVSRIFNDKHQPGRGGVKYMLCPPAVGSGSAGTLKQIPERPACRPPELRELKITLEFRRR